VATLLLAGCAPGEGSAGPSSGPTSAWRGTAISNPYPLPEQRFSDTAGDPVVPARDAAEDVTLVFFGYTHCPDICNVVLANIASALRGSPAAVRDATRLLFVTTDPARDTGQVVREYLDRFDPAYDGLIAPVGTVEQAASDLHVSYERPDGSTGGYRVDHGTYTTAFVDGEARLVWSADVAVADLRADLARLARIA
jgi:protein SCO1